MRKRYVQSADGNGLADAETGVIMDGAFVAVHIPKPRSPFGRRLCLMSLDGFDGLADRAHEFGFQGLRVLLKLLARLDYDNHIQIDHTQLAADLRMQRQNVGVAIKRLVDADVLLLGPRISNRPAYRLNPNYGWRGDARSHRQALDDRMKAAKLRVVANSEQLREGV